MVEIVQAGNLRKHRPILEAHLFDVESKRL